MTNNSSWLEHSKLVLHELESHSTDLKEIRADLHSLHTKFTVLQTKATIYGGIGGIIGGSVLGLVFSKIG